MNNKITDILHDIAKGAMFILVDNEQRENEGDFVIAAEKVTDQAVNFMIRYGTGIICLAITEKIATRLDLPLIPPRNPLPLGARFTYSIDAAQDISTGVSAHDRAHTTRVAIADNVVPTDIAIPGHLFPVLAHKDGLKGRQGHTEASIEVMRLAGLKPAALICEVINDNGTMARMPDLTVFAELHKMKIIHIKEIIEYIDLRL